MSDEFTKDGDYADDNFTESCKQCKQYPEYCILCDEFHCLCVLCQLSVGDDVVEDDDAIRLISNNQ